MERLWRWLAWKLPKRLVYWCVIRVATYEPKAMSREEFEKWELVPNRRFQEGLKFWGSQ